MWNEPQGKQRQSIARSNSRMNIWHGSVRSSKTVGANWRWMRYVALAVKHDIPGDFLMFGKTERTLKRNILDPLANFMGPDRFHYNKGEGEVYMWGRKIHVAGANDERAEGKIRGGTYLAAYGDELTLIPESFFKMLLSRLSLKDAKLFGTTNPDSPYHWLKADYLDNEDDLDLHSFHFTLDDNPWLDPKYVEELKKEYTGLWYKRFILGLWVQAAGAVYDMWSDKNVCKADPALVKTWIADCDYGTSNPCTFSLKGIWKEDDKTRVHTFREYYYDGRHRGQKTDAEYVEDLKLFLKDTPGLVRVYTDPSAASFITAGKKGGLRMVEANNDVLDGIRFTSSLVQDGQYTVDPACKETIKGYQSYIWDEKAQKRGEDKPLKENDHTCDRDRYGIFTHLGGERRTIGGSRVTL